MGAQIRQLAELMEQRLREEEDKELQLASGATFEGFALDVQVARRKSCREARKAPLFEVFRRLFMAF